MRTGDILQYIGLANVSLGLFGILTTLLFDFNTIEVQFGIQLAILAGLGAGTIGLLLNIDKTLHELIDREKHAWNIDYSPRDIAKLPIIQLTDEQYDLARDAWFSVDAEGREAFSMDGISWMQINRR